MHATRDPVDPASNPAQSPLDQRSWWTAAMAIAGMWVALVHASLWWLGGASVSRVLWGDERTYVGSALRILAGDPSWWPEPLWPPLYPQFLAGVMTLGGVSLRFVVVVQTGLLLLSAVLLLDLVRRWTDSRAAAVTAGLLVLGYLPLAAFAHYFWPEILHLFLFVALLWMLAMRPAQAFWCVLAGISLGLAVLAKSLLLPFAPVLLGASVWGRRPARVVTAVLLVLVSALITLAPALVGNRERTGRWSIANSATFNLWVGLNDTGRESFQRDVVWREYQRWEASSESPAERDRLLRSKIAELIHERGFAAVLGSQISKQYFRLFDAGCYLTDQLPGGAAQRRSGAGYVGAEPWFGRLIGMTTVISILLLLVATPTGFLTGGCRGHRWVRVLGIFLIYNLALFFWLHVKTRYRIQMLPAAFVGVGCLVAWFEAGCRPRPSVARVGALGVVVGLLLWFALG